MNYKDSPPPSCLQNHSTANRKVAKKPEIMKINVPPGTLVLPLSLTSLPHNRPIMLTPGAAADTFSPAATENLELKSISLSRRDC